MKDLKQQGAVPLSSFLRFDPWTDQLMVLHTAFEPILSASDKMPFEVSPVYLKLSYYKAPAPPAPPSAAAPADGRSRTPAPPTATPPPTAPAEPNRPTASARTPATTTPPAPTTPNQQ